MKHISVFDFLDYRAYLQLALPVTGPDRGARSRLADFLGCQNGFISQVLGGLADFSFEHAIQISRFLKQSKEEKEFFILIVHSARAGSKDLRDHYQEQINAVLARRRNIVSRLPARKNRLSDHDRERYYSSWHFVAIHMCLVIPQTQDKSSVAKFLNLPEERVADILDELLRMGLAQQEHGRYIGNYDRMHLSADSPLISKHHTNWRMRAIESLDTAKSSNLHYSLVMSISPAAAEMMRTLLLEFIQSLEPIMHEAKDEEVYVFTADLFDLRR